MKLSCWNPNFIGVKGFESSSVKCHWHLFVTVRGGFFCSRYLSLESWFFYCDISTTFIPRLCILSLCKCVQWEHPLQPLRVENPLCKSIYTLTHTVLVIWLVDYSIMCLSALTAVEGHQRLQNESLWKNKANIPEDKTRWCSHAASITRGF